MSLHKLSVVARSLCGANKLIHCRTSQEASLLGQLVLDLALGWPEVAFKLADKATKKVLLNLPKVACQIMPKPLNHCRYISQC